MSIFSSSDFTFVETADRTSVKAFLDTSKPDAPFLDPVTNKRGSKCTSCGGYGNR